jgi:2-polyprenyl-6-hydroxyphenyl methylase/3-demethylubiquinone-9 3-methyltransferase
MQSVKLHTPPGEDGTLNSNGTPPAALNQAAQDNTDPEELARFARLADDWWNPAGRLKTLHAVNPVRLAFLEGAVELKGKRILDIGCGGGLLSEAMAARGARVTGIDPGADSIAVAQQHAGTLPVEYRVCTVEAFAGETGEQFDIITCMEALEHVPDPPALLAAAAGLLAPGGSLFLSTINRNLRAYLAAVVGAEYLLGLLPKGTHDYARFIRPSELAGWLRRCGLDIVSIRGLHYLPVLNRAVLADRPGVNYLVHARRGY